MPLRYRPLLSRVFYSTDASLAQHCSVSSKGRFCLQYNCVLAEAKKETNPGPLPRCRNDAGLAAAELALAVESAVLGTESIDTVGTTGHVSLEPNAINSVPRKAHVEIGEALPLHTTKEH